jgi:hypothetical protein
MLRNTIAHTIIYQEYNNHAKNSLVRGRLRVRFCVQIIKQFGVQFPAKGGLIFVILCLQTVVMGV